VTPVATPTDYRDDPGDGLPARIVGAWAREKAVYVGKYMQIFAAGMKSRWAERVYVDLFAGPGVCVTRDTDDFYDGSPLVALNRPFTRHIYVDKDAVATAALEQRVAPWRSQRPIDILNEDCNDAVDRVVELIPKNAIVFAFLDPTAWQIRFETVRKLCDARRVDVLITFQVAALKRNRLRDLKTIDDFFGTERWRPALESGEVARMAHFTATYGAQMGSLGYLDVGDVIEPRMRISTGALLYTLRFYSKHERGHDFWREIASVEPSGQMQLLRVPATPRPR